MYYTEQPPADYSLVLAWAIITLLLCFVSTKIFRCTDRVDVCIIVVLTYVMSAAATGTILGLALMYLTLYTD